MWIFGKPAKILFFNNHLRNLILSLKKYQIKKKTLKTDILKIININLSKKKKYNHLLRIAVNKKIISISLRKRVKPKSNFNLKLAKIRRRLNKRRRKARVRGFRKRRRWCSRTTVINNLSFTGFLKSMYNKI